MHFDQYATSFKTAKVTRDDVGVITVQLHSRGAELTWNGLPHRELQELFAAVASDKDNKVMVLTGTGNQFVSVAEGFAERLGRGEASASSWANGFWEGTRLIEGLLDVGIPTIAAVNGPAPVHSELAVLCDIVICTEDTYFQDSGHLPSGLVPGDSVQVIWPLILGPNRGRYFLLTGQKLDAVESLRLGVVSEVLNRESLLPRAHELAADLAKHTPEVLRLTKRALVRTLRREMAHELEAGLAMEALASLAAAKEPGTPA